MRTIQTYRISVLVFILTTLAITLAQFLDPYLWFDESGQYFMGVGLNHYSAPLLSRGSLHDALVNNRIFNLDPGGFTVLVYFWTFLSSSVYFLRLLPLIFFIGSLICLQRILAFTGVEKGFRPVFLAFFAIFSGMFFFIAEFRAYSMELCGTLLTLWLYLKYSDQLSYKRLVTLSLVASFFCTSRYAFILVAFVLAIFVLSRLYRKEPLRVFICKALVFGMPLLLSVLLIYYYMTRLQTPGTLGYVGYIGKNISLLWSPLSLLFYLNLFLCAIRYRKEKCLPVVQGYALCVSVFFFVLSVCVLFPWDLKRAASVTLLNLISLMLHYDYFARGFLRSKWVQWGMDAFIVLCAAFLCYKTMHRQIDDVAREFEALDMSRYESVYVAYDSMPDVKYQYEFGRLRNRAVQDGYPDKFVFQVKQEQTGPDAYENRLLAPEDADCSLYFSIGTLPEDQFMLEGNRAFSYRKKNRTDSAPE